MTEENSYASAYELKKVFEGIAKIAEKLPASLGQDLKDAAECGISDTIGRITRVMETVRTFEETLDAKQVELCDRANEFYKAVKGKYEQVSKQLEALGSLPDNLRVPHGVVQVIELAERCQSMTDEQWARVIELAKALKQDA